MSVSGSDLLKQLRVSLRILMATTILLFGIVAASTAYTYRVALRVDDTSKRADIEIAQSRVGAVTATCEQANELSEILATLAFNSPAGQHPNAAFRKFYARLQPNDCVEMREILYQRLVVQKDFTASIPYSPDPKGNGIPEHLKLTPLP